MPYELSKAGAERARTEFQRVLESAVPAYEAQPDLFPEEDEQYIRREVERKLYVPKLPNAGEQERKWLARLKEMSYPDFWKNRVSAAAFQDGGAGEKSIGWLCARAHAQATALGQLLPTQMYDRRGRPNPGQYYYWKPVTSKTDRVAHKWFGDLRKAALEAREWEVKWLAEFMVGGLDRPGGTPEGVSDFRIEVLCGLRRWNGDVIRMVRVKNILGEETGILALEAECFKSPEHFRAWCLNVGNFSWHGNQTHLQDLHWDTNRITAWRIMNEVDAMGWHAVSRRLPDGKSTLMSETPGVLNGIWFYGDTAYHNGQTLERDRDDIYHAEGEGFFLAERGRESEYALGRPLMRPGVRLLELLSHEEIETFAEKPVPRAVAERGKAKGNPKLTDLYTEEELRRAYFKEVCRRFFETIGGHEAHLAIGAIFAYAVAPELFARHGLFPGLWVHGQMESGKTKFTEWLLHLAGFNVSAGISALKSSTVGILQESQNYSNLPLWIDEFRQGAVSDEKVGVFRDAYNRQPPVKWNPEGVQRKIRTAFVISGESTSSDAATRSRYPHVQVSAARRVNNHLNWFSRHKDYLFVFWRHVMERRGEFVTQFFLHLDQWIALAGQVNEREKMVHGIDWAAFSALNRLLGVEAPVEFDNWVVSHMESAAVDVTEETNINVFWTHMISAFKDDAIPLECFRIKGDLSAYPDGVLWTSYKLYLEPNLMLSALAAHLRKQGESVPLRRNDLRDQLGKAKYWVKGKFHQRFGSGAGVSLAWVIDVDEHPLGRQVVTPEEVRAAQAERPQKGVFPEDVGPVFADGDPRKGPLFAIIDKIERREAERRREEKENT